MQVQITDTILHTILESQGCEWLKASPGKDDLAIGMNNNIISNQLNSMAELWVYEVIKDQDVKVNNIDTLIYFGGRRVKDNTI